MTIVDKRTTRIFEWPRLPACPSIAVLAEKSAARRNSTRPEAKIAVTHLSRISKITAVTIDRTHYNRTTIA